MLGYSRNRFLNWALPGLGVLLGIGLNDLAWAGACCGRNSATPVLIVGDDHSQMGIGIAQAHKVGWVGEGGVLERDSSHQSDTSWGVRLDAATLLSDRIQIGATLPFAARMVSAHQDQETSSGVGDIKIHLAYEALPEWTYSPWVPQIFIFSSLSFPTANSVFESKRFLGTDVLGTGYFSTLVGSLLVKRRNDWDFFLVPETHYSLSRHFQTVDSEVARANPGWGGSMAMGVGWSPMGGAFRIGFRVQPRFEQSVSYEGLGDSYAGIQSEVPSVTWDTGIDCNYMLSSSSTLSISYTDQTILGVSTNSNLNRTVAISYQHRWER